MSRKNESDSAIQPHSPDRGNRTLLVWGGALLGVVALYYRLCWPTFLEFVSSMDKSEIPFADFVVFYYEMGREIFLSGRPVIGYLYSPFFAIILGFFGMFPPNIATIIWVVLIVACTAGIGYISYKVNQPQPKWLAIILAFVLATSFPVLHNFAWGQVGALLVLLLLGTFVAYERGQWLLAAFLLAFATSLKYYPILFALPFLFRKDWRFIAAFGCWCLLLFVGAPLVVLGADETWTFLGQVYQGTYGKQIAAGGPNSHFAANVIKRWLLMAGYEGILPEVLLRAIGLFVLEMNIFIVFFLVRRRVPEGFLWSFAILFLSVPFYVATSWPHYFLFLPFCQLLLFSSLRDRAPGLQPVLKKTLAMGTVASVFFSTIFFAQMFGGWKGYNEAGFLFVADVLLLLASYFILIPRILEAVPQRAQSTVS